MPELTSKTLLSATTCVLLALILQGGTAAQTNCATASNPIVCENQKPGDPATQWNVSGTGDATIQGFATQFSLVRGAVQQFKINTTANSYTIDIYRMGYYGGAGARRVATISPSVAPHVQPACITDAATGLVDCGNWGVSASWPVPADAVSGIYFARPRRTDNGGASHIFFVVRDDTGQSDLLFQTSDTTWQAYNSYGGNSLYQGNPAGRAFKVSYNRPFNTRAASPEDWVFNAEYPMVRWLEANGYNVSYFSGADTDRFGTELLEHRAFLSVGHDEYWSGAQRANVETARAAGVHLAFFSGNEVFWKTRWENSIDGSGTPYRTLVCYKETHANAQIDPAGSTMWTGTWRDARFSPPADGGRPENALTGTRFKTNEGTTSIIVPAEHGRMRFWRHTNIATLAPGSSAALPNGTLGYEWDEAPNDAFTPRGLMRLSLTTHNVPSMLLDNGSSYGPGSVTHSLTLYRHSSGALVFGAGTVQWSWGLDANHDRGSAAADSRMKQATANLFADMGVFAGTLEAGLTPPTTSPDLTPPASTIASPAAGASFASGTAVTISGSATDTGGIVAGVEVSVDGGTTWAPATGGASWTFNWTASGSGTVRIQSRAYDDSGHFETPTPGITVTVTAPAGCPCTIWAPGAVPPIVDDEDPQAMEIGTRFRSSVDGYVTGIRFYKGPLNTGTHVGRLWTNAGILLATVTFSNETASGWQQANLSSPVAITANTTYVVTYHAPNGHYTGTDFFFASSALVRGPLQALRDGVDGPNGIYRYGAGGVFPTETYLSEGYWVDVVFDTVPPPDTTPPSVTAVFPFVGAVNVNPGAAVTATFSEPMDPSSIVSAGFAGEGAPSPGTFELRDPSGALVRATVSYDAPTRFARLVPESPLALSTVYTAVVKGGATDPRVKDVAGNAMSASVTWSFTTAAAPAPPPACPCTIWTPDVVPQKIDDGDTNPSELGTRFRSDVDGYITGARYYKAPLNTGTHVAKLWTNTGGLLGTVTFTGESASGWQEATFPSPIPIAANTTYVISYRAPNGHYSSASRYFQSTGVDRPPLHALRDGEDGVNGAYTYGASAFPTQTFQSEGYFVDVVFNTSIGPDTTPPVVSAVSPTAGRVGVLTNSSVTATFNEALDPASITNQTMVLRHPSGATVPATVSYAAAAKTATLVPSSPLAHSTTYTVVIKGGPTDPRVKDLAGNAPAADHSWTFTTAAPPPPPPTQGPGGPILVVTSASNAFTTYYAEILRAEGANAFAVADIATVSAATLSAYDVVILGEMTLTTAQVTMFTNWVNLGGNLVAMRPDKKLAGLLGLTDLGTTLTNAYLQVSTAAAPGTGIVGETIQFHGVADRYSLNGATAVATLFSNATTATTNPAVTVRQVAGGGHAVAFTYDLARSIVYTRQGNPAWSGQERDGLAPIRSDDLFFGARTGDVQPDWVDFNKIAIPQADEQQRLLWNTILHINAARKPLPRFWYFPRMLKAIVVMTGDDHGNGGTAGRFDRYVALSPSGCSIDDWQCIRGTSYIFPNTPLSPAQVDNYLASGFELALHVNTNCVDWTPATLANFYSTQLTQFATNYPTVPTPVTNRTHCIAWSDYATQAQVAFNNRIRLDTNYYYYPAVFVQNRPGLFTGSAMPMRFATSTGTMIDVYQAATQFTDESNQTYPLHADVLFDRALGPEGYYGAFVANMHTDFNPSPGSEGSEAIIGSARARNVPVITAKQLLDWIDGRNGSAFQSIAWSDNVLSFDVAVGAGANGLRALVPASAGNAPITAITLNGGVVPHTLQTIKGVSYAAFAADAGAYRVTYGTDTTAPAITAVTASPTITSATVQWTTDEPGHSVVAYGTHPDALTQSASAAGLVTSHTVTLPGLAGGTTYYYRVSSADAAGNTSTSPALTNAPASFTTAPEPMPSMTIADASIAEGHAGTSTLQFVVTLSQTSTRTITVDYATTDVTATSGADYTAASGTLTFNPGQTSRVIQVLVSGDALNEPNETFTVTLGNPVNVTVDRQTATGTIQDDDPLPSITIGDASVVEGNSGTATAVFTLTLSAASNQTVFVSYASANGTATAGEDYVAADGSVTFAPGQTSAVVNISVLGDTLAESNETFFVDLSGASNATIARARATGTVVNDEPLPQLAIQSASVPEGDSGLATASFIVTLSPASALTVSVGYATANGTAVSGSDFTTSSGTLTFGPGTTQQTILVSVSGDTLHELDEQFVVNLSGAVNASIATGQATGTIVNDDAMPSISIADVTITEGNSGTRTATFALTLSAASSQTVTVPYASADGSASAGSDYTAVSGTVTFAAGATTASINVTVSGDVIFEANESFTINLGTATNATVARAQATGTITNDEATPALSIGDVTVAEGNAGTSNAVLTVLLAPASSQPVTVAYATADGTATAGTDYVAASGTLTFPAGATAQTITVTINGDTVNESSETIVVNLSAPIGATLLDPQATVTITNDEAVGLVAAYAFEEGAGTTTADASGNGHTGTISGATWSTTGRNGRALSFDGVNDMVSVADSAALDVTRVTMMAWVNPTTLSGWRTAILKETTDGLAYALYAHDDVPRPAGYVRIGADDRTVAGAAALPLNTWSHIAVTYDGTNLRFYVNGTLVGTQAVSGSITTSAQALRIGGNAVWGEFFAGRIDDVRIYNRALTQAEIAADMNGPVQ